MSPPRRDTGPAATWEAGISFVAGPVIGYFFDEWQGTSPWGLFGFTLLGAAAGVRRLFSLIATPPAPPSKGSDDGGTP